MEWSFIETPLFMKQRTAYFEDDEAFRKFQADLMANPEQGVPIPGGGGVRKLRLAEEGRGKGKRGGLRVIYLQLPQIRQIHLLHVYSKETKDDLTRDEIRAMAEIARLIKEQAMVQRRTR